MCLTLVRRDEVDMRGREEGKGEQTQLDLMRPVVLEDSPLGENVHPLSALQPIHRQGHFLRARVVGSSREGGEGVHTQEERKRGKM